MCTGRRCPKILCHTHSSYKALWRQKKPDGDRDRERKSETLRESKERWNEERRKQIKKTERRR
jgi:hypothetical protein